MLTLRGQRLGVRKPRRLGQSCSRNDALRCERSVKKRTAEPKDWSDSEKRQLAKLVREGVSGRNISAALGLRIASVKKMAGEMRLVLRKEAKKGPI
jgi:hypothetical protein